MQQSKVVRILKSLPPWEWNHLRDFIDSPFHNKNDKVKRLFYLLQRNRNNLSTAEIDRSTCFHEMYGEAAYDEQKLFNIFSLLMRKVNEFFSYATYRNQKSEQLVHLMEHQVGRRDWAALPYSARQLEKLIAVSEPSGSISPDFYAYRAGMMQIKKDLETQRLSNEAFYSTIRHLDRFYLESRLQLACEYLNRGLILRHDEHMILDIDRMIDHFLENEVQGAKHASLQLYSLIYKMLAQPDGKEYFGTTVRLLQQDVLLSQAQRRDGVTYCINHCIRRTNAGVHEYLSQLFELYAWAIREDILMEDGRIGEWHFKNIVRTAIRYGRLDWVENFVENYSRLLPESVRDNAYAFNQASIDFERQAYSAAKKRLLKVQFTDLFYSLDGKALLVKIYYEEGDFVPLQSLLHSLSVFLRRKSLLSGSQQGIYTNFIKAVHWMAELKEGKGHSSESTLNAKKQKLRKIKLDSPNMTQFNWFCAKMDEFEQA